MMTIVRIYVLLAGLAGLLILAGNKENVAAALCLLSMAVLCTREKPL